LLLSEGFASVPCLIIVYHIIIGKSTTAFLEKSNGALDDNKYKNLHQKHRWLLWKYSITTTS